MKKSLLLVASFLLSIVGNIVAQHEYVSISAYKADIHYLEKLESSPELGDLLGRLKDISNKSSQELEVMGENSPELMKLQSDVRDFIQPREAIHHDLKIENEVKKYLLSQHDIVFVDCINLQNDDWKLSPRKTYKYYEFDAVGKNALNFYVLLNGYYKLEMNTKTWRRNSRGNSKPYVYVEYKRAITYDNFFHRLIRK